MPKFFLKITFFGLAILAALSVLFGGYVWIITRNLPDMDTILKDPHMFIASRTTQVYAKDGSVILAYGNFRQKKVPLKEVSPFFIKALIATEDRRFYDHTGVDFIAVLRALVQNMKSGKFLEGGSTLTQQLARNFFLSNEKSLNRKIRESVLASTLEKKLTKEQILELYVNNIYFGEGAYGIGAASEIYFNKKPSQLNLQEAALLAGLPQAPSSLSPFVNRKASKARRDEVLTNMIEAGMDKDEHGASLNIESTIQQPVWINPNGRALANNNKAPYFNQYVMQQVMELFEFDEQTFWQSGLKIYTTLDVSAQKAGELAVSNQTAAFGRTRVGQEAALLSLEPQTGKILAYVGGRSFTRSQFDRVRLAKRSPGSAFKLFTYTLAMDVGYLPQRVYLDAPVQFGNWTPENYDKTHHGFMTIAQALAKSNNVVAVKVLQDVGINEVINLAHRMGIDSPLNEGLSLTLGGSSVNVMELVSAYAVLPNEGTWVRPYGIERIVDGEGKELYRYEGEQRSVIPPSTAATMTALLQGVIQYGTGTAANIGIPMAGKTGTSDDHRDAWFIGFTPSVVTGVWVGNDNNSPMGGVAGGSLPASIWKVMMRSYMGTKPIKAFNLSNAKTIAMEDFFGYDLENLSESERDAGVPIPPEEETEETPSEGEGGETLETEDNPDPSLIGPPPPPPDGTTDNPTLPPMPGPPPPEATKAPTSNTMGTTPPGYTKPKAPGEYMPPTTEGAAVRKSTNKPNAPVGTAAQ